MFTFFFRFFALLILNNQFYRLSNSCESDDMYKLYGTKTGYEEVRGRGNEPEFQVEGCTPFSMWFLTRHGSRYPDDEEIAEMAHILPKVRDAVAATKGNSLCDKENERIRSWKPTMTEFDDHNITVVGTQEMKQLGARMRQRFADILYNTQSTYYARAAINRTQITIEHFMNEFFLNKESLIPDVDFQRKDKILDYPSSCKKLKDFTANSTIHCRYERNFTKTDPYLNTVKEFMDRLNITKLKGIKDTDTFTTVYKACMYEYLVLNRTDAAKTWCAAFTKIMLQTLEFKEDLVKHCEYGYKYKISAESTCELRKHLIQFLRDILTSPKPHNTLFFTQGSTLIPFYTALGLYEGSIYKNGYEEVKNRAWRTSIIDPMNANVLFAVYKCNSSFKMKIFHNEKPVNFAPAACDSSNLCSISEFVKFLAPTTDKCDFKSLCSGEVSEADLVKSY